MPTNRRPISRVVSYRLSFWEKLSLEYGEADHRPGFRSDDEAPRPTGVRCDGPGLPTTQWLGAS